MSKKRPEVRILLKKHEASGKYELSLLDPATGRESRTGLMVGPDRASIDKQVRELKETLERSGSWVSDVKRM